jgi:hypothetical protein
VLDAESPVETLRPTKTWPVTIVAIFYILQGLAAGYTAYAVAAFYGASMILGNTYVGIAVLDAVFGVMLVAAGIGLLARIKACLTVAVVLAALYLAGTGASFIEVLIKGPEPMQVVANLAFIAIGCVQYSILRSRSTIALFSTP